MSKINVPIRRLSAYALCIFRLALFLLIGLGGFHQYTNAQLLDTVYTHRELDFFEKDEDLEGFDEKSARLIPNTDVFVNFHVGAGFTTEKKNLEELKRGLSAEIAQSGATLDEFRENSVIPYQLGVNLDVFIFDYYGFGFTYTRNHYFSHSKKYSTPQTSAPTNYYNETIGAEANAIGNNFQFSLMGRYPFSSGYVNNIYFAGGMGYSLSTLVLTYTFQDKINNVKREQEYTSMSHSFHILAELMFKVSHFNFGFGFLLNTITFSSYKLPENAEFSPQKFEAVKDGPVIYFKVGFNF